MTKFRQTTQRFSKHTRFIAGHLRFLTKIFHVKLKVNPTFRRKFASAVSLLVLFGLLLSTQNVKALFGRAGGGGVANNGGHSTRQPSGLGDSAAAYYPFDGDANDKAPVNRNNLTDNNTVTQAAGRTPNAGQFTAASSEYLSITDNTALSASSTDFSISAWVYLDSTGTDRAIIGKWATAGGATDLEYALYYSASAGNLFRFIVGNNSSVTGVNASTFGSPTTGTWYHIVAWHDDSGNTLNIQVNGGTADSAAFSSTVKDGTASFSIGRPGDFNGDYWNGRIDNIGFWKEALSSDERTWLYENGRGRGYTELTNDYKTNLQAYWDLNEPNGTRLDAYGSNNLTDNNTVTFAAGVNQSKAQKAADFAPASSEYLSVTDNSSFSIGNADFSLATWIYGDNVDDGVTRYFLSKYAASNVEYYIGKNDTSRELFAVVSGDGTNTTVLTGPVMRSSTWYFVVLWYDATADTINMQVNNGSIISSSQSTGIYDGTAQFSLGGLNGASNFWDGRADNTAIWKRVLTSEERVSLYNSGLGQDYRDVSNSLRKNLISWWDLDEPSGTRNDAHAYSGKLDGTVTNATQTTGKFGNAYAFDGSGDYIQTASSSTFSSVTTASVSMWIYPTNTADTSQTLFSWVPAAGNGVQVDWANTTTINCYIGTGSWAAATYDTTNVSLNQWHHLTCTWDGSTITMYVDGVSRDTTAQTGTISSSSSVVTIGSYGPSSINTFSFYGNIDDVRLYTRNLSSTEVTRQFNGSSPTAIDNTASAYYKMDEASGSVAKDSARGSANPNPLTDNNTVTQATGRQPNAAQFTAANSESLSITDNTSLSVGDIDFSISAWVYADTLPSVGGIVGKWNDTGSQYEYALYYYSSPNRFQFVTRTTGGSDTATANNLGAPSTGTWYFVVAWHDASANTVNIQVNNGTVDSTSTTGTALDTTAPFTIGSYNSSNYWNGRIANVGFWKKVLTSTERTSLYNGGSGKMFHDLGTNGETTSLEAYWNLTEASGTREDFDGTNDLTDNNTVTAKPNSAYKDSDTAAQFTSANSEYLSVSDNANLSTGNIDFSISAWVYLDSKTTFRTIATKGSAGGFGDYEYSLEYYNIPDRFAFDVQNGTDTAANLQASSLGSPSIGQWYFIVAWHDASANTVNIQVNNGTVDSTSFSAGSWDSTKVFQIGNLNSSNTYMDGRISNVGFWKRTLSSAERAALYNSGAGKNYNKLTATEKEKLFGYWNLDEASSSRADSHGSNTLTDNNTVTSNSGVPVARYANAGSFASASSETLSATSNTSLQTGNIDFTLAGWFLAADVSSARVMAGKDGPSNREWFLYFDQSGDNRFEFWIEDGANPGTFKTVVNTSGPAPTADTWYFLVAWHDASADTINIQVNNGTADSAATSGAAPTAGTAAFILGGRAHADTYWNGRIDNFGFWKRTLTSDEKTALYNKGIGKAYSDLTGGEKQTLISWWGLDESSGYRFDEHGGNSGAISGATVAKEGVFGNAYSFDGTDDYIDLGDQATLESSGDGFTLSAWIKTSSTPTSRMIVAKKDDSGAGYYMWVSSSGKLEGHMATSGSTVTGTATSTKSVNDNEWHHVVFVRSTNALTLYVDGVTDGTATASGTLGDLSNSINARIGRSDHSAGPYYFRGNVDDVRIYPRALSAAEILDQYRAGAKQ